MGEQFSQQTIERRKKRTYDARRVEIASVIGNRETLVSDGFNHKLKAKRYRIKGTKIVICGNSFYDNNGGTSGNPIEFMQYHYGMDFNTALDQLTDARNYEGVTSFKMPTSAYQVQNRDKLEINLEEVKKEIDSFQFPEQDMVKQKNNIIYYLTQRRKLDSDIVQWLINKRLVRQDNHKNAVFVWYDRDGNPCGADIKGTSGIIMESTGREYLSVMKQSVNGLGFNVKKGVPNKVVFFEAPIDLISYLCLHKGNPKLNNTLFVSLGGLKEVVIRTFLEMYPEVKEDITFAMDNDDKAETFIENHFKDLNFKREKSETKDWNDDLKKMREIESLPLW